MNFIKHIFKKHLQAVLSLGFLIVFATTFHILAVAPVGGYAPGETLNPDCLPGSADCVVTIPSDYWSLTGDAGTVDGTNFIGTTDNVPFNIRVNNQKAGRIDNGLFNTFWGYQAGNSNSTGSGNVFLGYQAGYNELGSDKLYISNSDTATPLIYGDFADGDPANQTLTINGNLTVTGTCTGCGGGGTSIVQEIVVDLTADQIKTANSVPINTGISVSAGEAIEVVRASIKITAGTTPFSSTTISLITDGASDAQKSWGTAGRDNFIGDANVFVSLNDQSSFSVQLVDGADLFLKSNADSVAGDGTAKVYISYRIITL